MGRHKQLLDLLKLDDPGRVGDALDGVQVVVADLPQEEEEDDLDASDGGTYLEEELYVADEQRHGDDVGFEATLGGGAFARPVLDDEQPNQVVYDGQEHEHRYSTELVPGDVARVAQIKHRERDNQICRKVGPVEALEAVQHQ